MDFMDLVDAMDTHGSPTEEEARAKKRRPAVTGPTPLRCSQLSAPLAARYGCR